MANELRANFNGTANLYAIIRNRATGYVWNGSAFVAWENGSIATFDIPLSSFGGDLYMASFPTSIAEGDYYVDYYVRDGSNPATTDTRLGGVSMHWTGTAATEDDEDPTASEMVSILKRALRDSPAGVSMITVDGQQVQYSRAQAMNELKFWQQQAAQEAGTRRRAASIYMGGF
jgi:hypothetical protein